MALQKPDKQKAFLKVFENEVTNCVKNRKDKSLPLFLYYIPYSSKYYSMRKDAFSENFDLNINI